MGMEQCVCLGLGIICVFLIYKIMHAESIYKNELDIYAKALEDQHTTVTYNGTHQFYCRENGKFAKGHMFGTYYTCDECQSMFPIMNTQKDATPIFYRHCPFCGRTIDKYNGIN